jgi:hypothetical protein
MHPLLKIYLCINYIKFLRGGQNMRNKTFWFPVILISFTVIFWTFALATEAQTAQEPSVKEGDTEYHFQKAHEFFLKKDFKTAASEIRKGADFMKKEAESATEEGKKVLAASVQELGKLATDVEKGAVKSEKELKDTFARANNALARHHYLKASEQWAKKETKSTGNALKNAAQYLEQAAKWSGHKLEAGSSEVVKGARAVADKLIQGTKWVAEEVSKGIKDMGNEISKLGKQIEPKK